MIVRLPFLAHRSYLHGTTLFDTLIEMCSAGPPLTMKISRMIETNEIEISKDPAANAAATFTWTDDKNGANTVYVVPSGAPANVERKDYDENRVSRDVVFDRDSASATLHAPWPFSFVATLIPLHKVLLANMSATAGVKNWLFSRIELNHFASGSGSLAVQFDGSLASGRIVRSQIKENGKPLGVIYYSRRMEEA